MSSVPLDRLLHHPAIGGYGPRATDDQVGLVELFGQRNLTGDLTGHDHIVRIKELDIKAGGKTEAGIASRRSPLIALVDDGEREGALRFKHTQDRKAIIRTAIVHTDHFQITMGLCEDMLQATLQVRGNIVTRNDHGHLHTAGWVGMVGSTVRVVEEVTAILRDRKIVFVQR